MPVHIAEKIRSEIAGLRRQGRIPTELRLDQERWNELRHEMRYAPFGSRRAVLFEGLPCVLTLGLRSPGGFAVRFIEPRGE